MSISLFIDHTMFERVSLSMMITKISCKAFRHGSAVQFIDLPVSSPMCLAFPCRDYSAGNTQIHPAGSVPELHFIDSSGAAEGDWESQACV
jgi:hypothetical protein